MARKVREPVSGFTHLAAAILSVIGTIILLIFGTSQGSAVNIAAFLVFGISLILLYTASSLYHLLPVSKKAISILRRIDHMMIYVLIAGTYTPLCLIILKGKLGIGLLIAIWSLAFIGIALKMIWFNAPRWLYTGFYLLMGWLAVIAIFPMVKMIPPIGIWLVVAGGIAYTLGAVIYGAKWPGKNAKVFGFHEIFHIFVMLGSLLHYLFVFNFAV